MSESMRVWVVNHPFVGRRWCQLRAREPNTTSWRSVFAWIEWNGPAVAAREFVVPRMPLSASYPISNVDPLVVGPQMFFDYCKKGRRNSLLNLRAPNDLASGDIVLFASRNANSIYVDTMFVIGAFRPWPQAPGAVPDWGHVGPLAERVHFHPFALRQHPEVQVAGAKVTARSYRGASDIEPVAGRFCWVPYATAPRAPLQLKSEALRALEMIYQNKNLLDGMTGSFGVATCTLQAGAVLFDRLTELARAEGFGVAAELALAEAGELEYGGTEADALACGDWKHADEQDVRGLCDDGEM